MGGRCAGLILVELFEEFEAFNLVSFWAFETSANDTERHKRYSHDWKSVE